MPEKHLPVHGVGPAGARRRTSACTAAYVGSQGRNLFLRSVANQIIERASTNPNPASAAFVIRAVRDRRSATRAGNITGVQNPYAEIDYKTSGGHDSYNAHAARAEPPVGQRPVDERAVHAGEQQGQHRRIERSADGGQQRADARPSSTTTTATTTSTSATLQPQRCSISAVRPRAQHRDGVADACSAAGTSAASSTRAAACRSTCCITRPRHRLRGRGGQRLQQPGGRAARRSSTRRAAALAQRAPAGPRPRRRSVHQERRPAVPEPGGVRDAEARHVRQPRAQLAPRAELPADRHGHRRSTSRSAGRNGEFRMEIFNLFNRVNFANPVGDAAERAADGGARPRRTSVQPGQAFTSAAAGTFGTLTSTVGTHGRPRHEPADAARVPPELLDRRVPSTPQEPGIAPGSCVSDLFLVVRRFRASV